MSTILCTKDFSITVNPDPTFQGLLWLPVFTLGAPNWTASKERFNLNKNMGSAETIVFDAFGGDGAGGQIVIPAVAQQRNCKLHLDITVNGLGYNFVPGDFGISFNYDQLAPFVHHVTNVPAGDLVTTGGYDYAFTLAAGKAFNFDLHIRLHVQVAVGAFFLNFVWSGFLYVESYV